MNVCTDYHGSYVDATYEDAVKMAETFEKIIRLPKKSLITKDAFQLSETLPPNGFHAKISLAF